MFSVRYNFAASIVMFGSDSDLELMKRDLANVEAGSHLAAVRGRNSVFLFFIISYLCD